MKLFVVAAVAVLLEQRLNGRLKGTGRRVERGDREEYESEAKRGQKLNLRSN